MGESTSADWIKSSDDMLDILIEFINKVTFGEKFYGPTLMLLGRQDSVVGYKDAWSILENFLGATFAMIDMAAHNLQIEQEKIFNTLVTDWIKRVHIEN